MNLMDTVPMMNSASYKARMRAEYWQTKIRYEKLHRMTVQYEAGTLDFEPACELSLLLEQKKHMGLYLNCLEIRAEVEGIDLGSGDPAGPKGACGEPYHSVLDVIADYIQDPEVARWVADWAMDSREHTRRVLEHFDARLEGEQR